MLCTQKKHAISSALCALFRSPAAAAAPCVACGLCDASTALHTNRRVYGAMRCVWHGTTPMVAQTPALVIVSTIPAVRVSTTRTITITNTLIALMNTRHTSVHFSSIRSNSLEFPSSRVPYRSDSMPHFIFTSLPTYY